MNYLSEKLKKINPYTPNEGEYRIRLDANESFIDKSDAVLSRYFERIKAAELNRYPDPAARELVERYADFYGISAKNVVAGNGSDELISVIVTSFLTKGDTLAVTAPDFSMYAFYAESVEANAAEYKKDEGLCIDLDEFAEFVKKNNAKMVILSNPCNPTGRGLAKTALEKFIKECGCMVVADEAYMDFWDEKESFLKDVEEYDNLIVLRTMSKALGCAGARLGFAVAKEYIIKALMAAKSPYNVSVLSQEFGCAVLEDKNTLCHNISLIKEEKKALDSMIAQVDCEGIFEICETVTNFALIRFRDAQTASYAFERLKKEGIAVRAQKGIYFRITAGSKEENKELVKALCQITGEIKKW